MPSMDANTLTGSATASEPNAAGSGRKNVLDEGLERSAERAVVQLKVGDDEESRVDYDCGERDRWQT